MLGKMRGHCVKEKWFHSNWCSKIQKQEKHSTVGERAMNLLLQVYVCVSLGATGGRSRWTGTGDITWKFGFNICISRRSYKSVCAEYTLSVNHVLCVSVTCLATRKVYKPF